MKYMWVVHFVFTHSVELLALVLGISWSLLPGHIWQIQSSKVWQTYPLLRKQESPIKQWRWSCQSPRMCHLPMEDSHHRFKSCVRPLISAGKISTQTELFGIIIYSMWTCVKSNKGKISNKWCLICMIYHVICLHSLLINKQGGCDV